MPRQKLLDVGSYLTIGVTLVLFIVALFVKGLTHDLLLEAAVFLVSTKLVLMSYKSNLAADDLRNELRRLQELLEPNDVAGAPLGAGADTIERAPFARPPARPGSGER
jgi:hypothetical protein